MKLSDEIGTKDICSTVDQEYWIADPTTYTNLQKIKRFVHFVAELPFASNEDRQKAGEIISLIENIDNPSSFKEWCVCFDITDPSMQSEADMGIYFRKWWIRFEMGCLLIEAESIDAEDFGLATNQFFYYGCVYFQNNFPGERIFLDTDPDEFVNDAIGYEKYLTPTLNKVNITIDLWDATNN